MSNKKIDFEVGEYIDVNGNRFGILAAHRNYRWIDMNYGVESMSVDELRERGVRPAPVIVERWLNVYPPKDRELTVMLWLDTDTAYEVGLLKLTFEDGKLVKAEVEK